MLPKRENDYKYEYPLKALRFGEININVRKMREDEMPDDLVYYCDVNGTIYSETEENFELLTLNNK